MELNFQRIKSLSDQAACLQEAAELITRGNLVVNGARMELFGDDLTRIKTVIGEIIKERQDKIIKEINKLTSEKSTQAECLDVLMLSKFSINKSVLMAMKSEVDLSTNSRAIETIRDYFKKDNFTSALFLTLKDIFEIKAELEKL